MEVHDVLPDRLLFHSADNNTHSHADIKSTVLEWYFKPSELYNDNLPAFYFV